VIDYLLYNKLKGASRFVGGEVVFGTFTVWCWTLLGLYFTLAGLISVCDVFGWEPHEYRSVRVLCRLAWVLFEVAFTCALFVFTIVWLVLVPAFYMYTGSDLGLLSFLPVCVHNVNIVLIGIEAVVNRLQFERAHFVFVVYYAGAYLVFSWIFYALNGFFFYFFIDWRRPSTLGSYTLLLGVLAAFFFFGQWVSWKTKANDSEDEPGGKPGGESNDDFAEKGWAVVDRPDVAEGDLTGKEKDEADSC